MFLVVNVACVLALLLTWRIGLGSDASLQPAVFALAALSIAAIGALTTALVPMAFGHSRLEIDYAASTFVLAATTASVLHLIATPEVGSGARGPESAQFWKPVLGAFACVGALTIALTTLTGRERQIRPLMIAIVLPAVLLLPSDSFFTFIREDKLIVWAQRLLETGITAIILGLMWYVFGPGWRRSIPPVPRAQRETGTEMATT